jgi:hypothetical protein
VFANLLTIRLPGFFGLKREKAVPKPKPIFRGFILDFKGDGWTEDAKRRVKKLFSHYTPGMFNDWELRMSIGEKGEECPTARKIAPQYDDFAFGGSWEQLKEDLDTHYSV